MTDIVERLMEPVMLRYNAEQVNAERREAADEIKRLREELKTLQDTSLAVMGRTNVSIRAATIEECADEDMIAASLFASDGNGLFPLDATSLEIEAYTIRARDVCAAIRALAKAAL